MYVDILVEIIKFDFISILDVMKYIKLLYVSIKTISIKKYIVKIELIEIKLRNNSETLDGIKYLHTTKITG